MAMKIRFRWYNKTLVSLYSVNNRLLDIKRLMKIISN